jgi:plastocyanin
LRRRGATALGLAAALLLPTAVGAPAHPGHGPVAVNITDFSYKPETVRILQGDIVIWQWQGPDTNHSVTSDGGQKLSWDSDQGKSAAGVHHKRGDLFTEYFGRPGTYTYHCKVHPFMTGTVVVTPYKQPPVDRTAPKLTRVSVSLRGRRATLHFRLSEAASVTARVRRRGSSKVVKDAFGFARRGAGRLALDLRRLRAGRYRVSASAEDDTGNRSKTVTVALHLR